MISSWCAADEEASGRRPKALQPDLSIEFSPQAQPGDLQRHSGREGFRACDRGLSHGTLNGVLDLALGVDAHHLQELADAGVELVLVHGCLSWETP